MKHHHDSVCCIVPPSILVKLTEQPEHRAQALKTLMLTEQLRGRRSVLGPMSVLAVAAGQERRTIYDAQQGSEANLPGKLVRGEGDNATGDAEVDEPTTFPAIPTIFTSRCSTATQSTTTG